MAGVRRGSLPPSELLFSVLHPRSQGEVSREELNRGWQRRRLQDRASSPRTPVGDFVVENGPEFFNRSLYGGNTAFRVDGGDKPEFMLYLPGRGGNLRLGIKVGGEAKWLKDAEAIKTRYRAGELIYEVRDKVFG